MEHFKNNEIFISEEKGGMKSYINIEKFLEAVSKGNYVDTKKRESKRTPKHTESFMRFESKELDVAYRSYYHQLNEIEEMPLDEQLSELTKLFQDISLQYDPPMFCEEAYDFADELNSSGWREESKEDPPFASITIDDPAMNLAMSQAKMLYVYWEIREQLRFRLKYFVKKRKEIAKDEKTNREKEREVEKSKMPKEETMYYRSIGKKLEDWYEEYHKFIVKYDVERQIIALNEIRNEVLALTNYYGKPYVTGGPTGLKHLIFVTPTENNYPRLDYFRGEFIQTPEGEPVNIAWETPMGERYAPIETLAEFGVIYFFSALNYEIELLKGVMAHDKIHEEGGRGLKKQKEKGERTDDKNPPVISETLTSKYNGQKLLKVYKNLTDKEYLFCTEDAWLYVWGVKVHPTKKNEIKAPTELPRWSAMQGKKTAIGDMIRTLMATDCGKPWKKTAKLFLFSDGSQPVESNLKSCSLQGPSKTEFLKLVIVH